MTTEDDVRAFNERFSAAPAAQDMGAAVDAYTEDARISDGETRKYVVVHERQPDGSLKMAVDAPGRDA